MELNVKDRRMMKFFNKCGKRLLVHALDGFYYFEDDKVEDLLDKALLKFQNKINWRKLVRSYLWSFQDIRFKICQAGFDMWADNEYGKYLNDLAFIMFNPIRCGGSGYEDGKYYLILGGKKRFAKEVNQIIRDMNPSWSDDALRPYLLDEDK